MVGTLSFSQPSCAYNPPPLPPYNNNLHQEPVPPLQQFFTSIFLLRVIPAIYIKSIFPTSTIKPNQAASKDQ